MEQEDRDREAFSKALIVEGLYVNLSKIGPASHNAGEYADAIVQTCWRVWQLALAYCRGGRGPASAEQSGLKVIVTRGLPASGKSTWAKEQLAQQPGRYKRICKDDLRWMLDNGQYSQENEKFILKVRDTLILLALQEGYHVIVDDTNLHPRHEQAIRELVKGQALVEIKDFTNVPLETCLERDRNRPNYVGEQAILSMYRQFIAQE